MTHREKVIREILSTEVTYTDSLTSLLDFFRSPMLQGNIITKEQDQIIFLNTEAILNLHKPLLENLRAELKKAEETNSMETICIGKILLDIVPWLRLYSTYINGVQEGSDLIAHLNKNDDNFRYALIGLCADSFSGLLGISSLRQVPVQRVPRYVLLLKDLIKHTEKDHPDFELLCKALSGFEHIATEINEKKRSAENQAKLQEYDEFINHNRNLLLEDSPDSKSHNWKNTRISSPSITCSNPGCGTLLVFGKKYSKCIDCNAICHKDCINDIPNTCCQKATLIKYDRILIRDGIIQSSRVRVNSGKKMEAPRSSNVILFNDYLIVCFAITKDSHNLEIDAVIRWYSVSTGRKASIKKSEHDGNSFSITSPTDGDIHTFTCGTVKERDDWFNDLSESMNEWMGTYASRHDTELLPSSSSVSLLNNSAPIIFTISHTVPVSGAKGKKVFMAFVIDFHFEKRDWSTIKRYSQFDNLYKQLKREVTKKTLPSLPPKRIFLDNNDPSFVKTRCARLEKFLNSLVEMVPEILTISCFLEFLFESDQNLLLTKPTHSTILTVDDSVIPETKKEEEEEDDDGDDEEGETIDVEIRSPRWSVVSPTKSQKQSNLRKTMDLGSKRTGFQTATPTAVRKYSRAEILPTISNDFELEGGEKVTVIDDASEKDHYSVFANGKYIAIPKIDVKILGGISRGSFGSFGSFGTHKRLQDRMEQD